jgi:hypothetical protein
MADLINVITVLAQRSNSAYEAGRTAGRVFGIIFLVVIALALFKKFRGD